jgi:hypothetical protein
MQTPGSLSVGQFENMGERRAYQTQLQAIRSQHGASPKAAKLIQLLNAKTRSRQKDRPAYIASILGDILNKTGRASAEAVITCEQMQPRVNGVSLKLKGRSSPKHTRASLDKYRINKTKNRVKLILANLVQPSEALRWMAAPNPALDSYSPAEAIEMGAGDRVVELLVGVSEGIYV